MHNDFIGGDILDKDPFCAGYKKIFKHIELFLEKELSKIEIKSGGIKNE